MQTTPHWIAIFAWLLLGALARAQHDDNAPLNAPLNVVFILVDDLGWSDIGCYGSDFYETPQIDALAKRSILFTQAYAAAPVCSPTRAAILTGKFPARLDMTIWHEGAVDGGPHDRKLRAAVSRPNLALEETTLAEIFRDAGYATSHIGKWHLGTAAYYPEVHGYDLNIGATFWGAPATFFHPFRGPWRNGDPEIRYVPGLSTSKQGDYLPDKITDKAIEVLQTASANKRPFLMSLWYHTVHSPIEAPSGLVEKYRAKREGKNHKDPTYAAMIERMDYNVGRVTTALRNLKLDKNTIVVFTSDNGGVDFDVRGIVPTSNAPLRSGKGTLYEGGLRVPLLIRWPEKAAGTRRDTMVSSQDFFPTFANYLNSQPKAAPLEFNVDGQDLTPLLDADNGLDSDRAALARDTLYWHFPHYYPRMTPGSALRHKIGS